MNSPIHILDATLYLHPDSLYKSISGLGYAAVGQSEGRD